ncbi:hypothetical protein ACFFRR_009548 [Megaselia abdita]
MFLHSGKRKRITPPKIRKERKVKEHTLFQHNPFPNISLSFLNSSESLHSFSMEEQFYSSFLQMMLIELLEIPVEIQMLLFVLEIHFLPLLDLLIFFLIMLRI